MKPGPWLTLGLVRCCSLLSSLSLCSRSNSSRISAGVLLLSTTYVQNQDGKTAEDPGGKGNVHKELQSLILVCACCLGSSHGLSPGSTPNRDFCHLMAQAWVRQSSLPPKVEMSFHTALQSDLNILYFSNLSLSLQKSYKENVTLNFIV